MGEQLTAYDAFVQGCCRATRLAAALRCCIGLRPGTGLSAVNLPDSIRSTARAVPLQAAGDDVLLSADRTDAGAAELAGGTCGYPGLTGTSLLSAPYGPALGTVPGPGATVISIHAPLAGRDLVYAGDQWFTLYFNPRAPCGARPQRSAKDAPRAGFQSTRPLRGATVSPINMC